MVNGYLKHEDMGTHSLKFLMKMLDLTGHPVKHILLQAMNEYRQNSSKSLQSTRSTFISLFKCQQSNGIVIFQSSNSRRTYMLIQPDKAIFLTTKQPEDEI